MTPYDLLDRGSPAAWAVGSVAALATIVAADALTGPDITFSLFYALPVAMMGWRCRRVPAAAFAVVAVVAWQTVDFAKGRFSPEVVVYAWHFGSRTLFLVALTAVVASLRSALARERDSSLHDYLTGTFNARAFYALSERELHRARRLGLPLTLIYLDVDNFKTVNDTLGHTAGDDLLKAVAHALTNGTRITDLVSRLGGDEFVILLPETGAEAARMIASKLRAQLEETVRHRRLAVTFSLGVLTLRVPTSVSAAELVSRADALMYLVKRGIKNGMQCFEDVEMPTVVEHGRFARRA